MAVPMSKERRIKRLEDQVKKHIKNPKMVSNLKQRIVTLKNSK